MRFLIRSLTGVFLLSLTLALIILAAAQIFWALQEARDDDRPNRPSRERIFSVNVATLTSEIAVPVITAYGNVRSARSFEIRASSAGSLVQLAPDFRDGGSIAAGQLMLQIDPAKSETALALARADLADAQTDLNDAFSAMPIVASELAATESQLTLRKQTLDRQENLRDKGIGTEIDVENAALSVASSEQTLLNQQKSLAQAETRIARAEITVQRREISVNEARRTLIETEVFAPYDGLLLNVTAVPGRLVSSNERLGELIDPTMLEIAFRISNAQFARLLDADGQLLPMRVSILFEIADLPLTISGNIDRASAEVGEGQTGRLVYASIDGAGAAVLRPGDFVIVSISETPLNNVSIVPATAVDATGKILLLGENDRLEEASVRVLRYQGDNLIITGAPFGKEYVTARSPQIGVGIRVKPLREEDASQVVAPEGAGHDKRPASGSRTALDTSKTVALTEEQREVFTTFIEGNSRMPAEAKQRFLTQLSQPEVPVQLVERLESFMGR